MAAHTQLLTVNTKDGIVQGDGWRFTLRSNSGQKVISICPVLIHIPNVFPNVNAYRNTWVQDYLGTPVTKTVPVGQYSNTELVAALNAVAGTDFTFSYNSSSLKYTVTCVGTKTISSADALLEILGFRSQTTVGTNLSGANVNVLSVPTTLTAAEYPNLGGEKLIHLHMSTFGGANCINSVDGSQYPVVASVSLAETAFGQTVKHEGDYSLMDIDHGAVLDCNAFDVWLTDSMYRTLKLPRSYYLEIVLKLFHVDTWNSK